MIRLIIFLVSCVICLCAVHPVQGSQELPHLTPKNLVGTRFPPNTFGDIKFALVGFCPPPALLAKYEKERTGKQYFIHVPPSNVQICSYGGIKFLSISHVYGGPVSSALIEELSYYGIKYVFAYGLAGGLGTKGLKMGDFYLIESAFACDGTTGHYTKHSITSSSGELNKTIMQLVQALPGLKEITTVKAVTTDAIYREYVHELNSFRSQGCDIINCDSSHLFVVSDVVGIETVQCGVLSDVIGLNRSGWESSLSAMLSEGSSDDVKPLERLDEMIQFYVEKLLPYKGGQS